MLTVDQAYKQLLEGVNIQPETEVLELADAVGRVLSEDVVAAINVPPLNNSAMDGFALKLDDLWGRQSLPISACVYAGSSPCVLKDETAARIFTGAVIPEYADTVIAQEDCIYDERELGLKIDFSALKRGQHIRCAGEDITEGQVVLRRGHRLEPSSIGLLASVGCAVVAVFKVLDVVLISTGDELVEVGQALKKGQIYNSNGPMLRALLLQAGFRVEQLHLKDDLVAITEALREKAEQADVLVTIGGVSVGDADFVKLAVESLGEISLWKVAMKPGKPLSFGKIAKTPVIGLPGNPVSAFATMQIFGLPFLLKMQGLAEFDRRSQKLPVVLAAPMHPTRENFLRVTRVEQNGVDILVPFVHQGSGVLSSVAASTGFARIVKDQLTESMDLVEYWPFVFDRTF